MHGFVGTPVVVVESVDFIDPTVEMRLWVLD